jgi:hypothetical protein
VTAGAGAGAAVGAGAAEGAEGAAAWAGAAAGFSAFGGFGAAEARELLAEFGASKGPNLKPEQFAEFGEKIDALLAKTSELA